MLPCRNMSKKTKLQNIAVPDEVLRKIKARAAAKGVSIREFVGPFLQAIADGKTEVAR